MKGDTPLDYAEFQLTQTRTRCELFVSAEGVTEKLASGFLKPFVTHLRAAEEQVARGSQVIRLERRPNFSEQTDKNWFTKGTLERFVRFVSTPEVIGRVKTIEDELIQLEQVRSTLANTCGHTEDRFRSTDTALSPSDGKVLTGVNQERDGTSIMPRRFSTDVDGDGAEASKRELLRAMDVRLAALKQEQNLAFSRAAAAGFDSNNMADLMAFAEYFGANRLGEACVHFIALFRKRQFSDIEQEEMDSPNGEAASSGSDMSLASGNEADLGMESAVTSHVMSRNSFESWSGIQKKRSDTEGSETAADWVLKLRPHEKPSSAVDNAGGIRTRSNTDSRRRWGPPEKLQMDYSHPWVHSSQDAVRPGTATEMNAEALHHTYLDDQRSGMLAQSPGEGVRATVHHEDHSTLPNQGSSFVTDLNGKQAQVTKNANALCPPEKMVAHGHNSRDQKTESVSKGGMFYTRLQQMAQQVEARSGEDLRGSIHSTSSGFSLSDQSQDDSTMPDTSSMWMESSCIPSESNRSSSLQTLGDHSQSSPDSNIQTQVDDKIFPQRSPSPERSSSSPSLQKDQQLGSPGVWCPRSVVTQSVNHSSSQDGSSRGKGILKGSEGNHGIDSEGSKNKDNQEEPKETTSAPARRLSVQDAISLFESKKKDSDEPPIKRLVKQESRRGSLESGNSSTSEKAVLRRWSGATVLSSGESYLEEKNIDLDSPKVKKIVQPDFLKPKDGEKKDSLTDGNRFSHSKSTVESQFRPVADKQETEGLKSSSDSNTLLAHQQQSEQGSRTGLSTSSEADASLIKPSRQQHSPGGDSLSGLDGELQKQFKIELAKSLTREARNNDPVSVVASSRSEADSVKAVNLSNKRPSNNLPTGLTDEGQPNVNCTQLDGKVKDELQEKANLSGQTKQNLQATQAKQILQSTQNVQPPQNLQSTQNLQPTQTKQKLQPTQNVQPMQPTQNLQPTQTKQNLQSTSDGSGANVSSMITREHTSMGQRTLSYSNQEWSTGNEREITNSKEIANNGVQNFIKPDSGRFPIKMEQISGREPLGNAWNAPLDVHMQALVKMVDQQYHDPPSLSGEESLGGQRGRFYEQYGKLRDAKLRGEHPLKKAEREAKLKAMQETLERRKAEMEARTSRLPKKNNPPVQARLQAEKPRNRKAGLLITQTEQEEEEEVTDQEDYPLQMQDQPYEYSSPTSPASTPRAAKNQVSTLKPRAVKKTAPTLQKSATTPRSSSRTAASSSPRSTPKNPTGTPSQRKSAPTNQNGTADNALARSVPNFADLRKETAKPSLGRTSSSARVHPKTNGHSGHSRTPSEAVSLVDANGNIVAYDDALSVTDKEEIRRPSVLTRKSCASVSEFKASSAPGLDAGVLEPLREGTTDPPMNGKLRRTAVAPTQEVKPFLRKGRGIGPGAGPGVMKQKATVTTDAAKSSDEEAPATPTVNVEAIDSENHKTEVLETEESLKSLGVDDSEGPVESESNDASNLPIMRISIDGLPSVHDDQPENSEVEALDFLPEGASNNDRSCHTISSPSDLQTPKHLGTFIGNSGSHVQVSFPEVANHEQKEGVLSAPLSQLLAQRNSESRQHDASFVTASGPFRAISLPHEHITSPFSLAAAVPASSSLLQPVTVSGHFSPPPAMAMDSPLGSPASWNSSQIQYPTETDLVRSRRQWSGPQKPALVITQPPKEPAKGFKRLLKFGRKSRASETATTDWVSASTTSEGDDDAEEPRDLVSQSSDDLLRRARLQERGFEFGSTGDHYSFQDQGAIQLLQSSIPAPPANFKLREDHLSGGTLLKAPRSFFSLSSFRSRGSEGKSR